MQFAIIGSIAEANVVERDCQELHRIAVMNTFDTPAADVTDVDIPGGIPLVLGGDVFGWTADEAASFAILDIKVRHNLSAPLLACPIRTSPKPRRAMEPCCWHDA